MGKAGPVAVDRREIDRIVKSRGGTKMPGVLLAEKPEDIVDTKPKFLISGKPGVGKTMFTLEFPLVYYIDTESGAVRKQYKKKLIERGGGYLGKNKGSQDFQVVIDQIKTLATVKHNYKTLVIDSFSYLYNLAAAQAEEKIGNDFGRDRKEANRPTRQLLRWLETLDMTVVLICHSREKWERRNGELIHAGTTFDGFEKMEYILDLWIEAVKEGNKRFFVIRKSRIDSFKENDIHPLDYGKFAELYGKEIIEKETEPVKMATEDQISKIHKLLEFVRIEETIIDKWFDKAGAEKWDDFTFEQIQKCIDMLESKLQPLSRETTKMVNSMAPEPEVIINGKDKKELGKKEVKK